MRTLRAALGTMLLAVLVLSVAGCRDESERPLRYDKGVYGGSADQPLGQKRRDALKLRAERQRVF